MRGNVKENLRIDEAMFGRKLRSSTAPGREARNVDVIEIYIEVLSDFLKTKLKKPSAFFLVPRHSITGRNGR